MTTSSLDLRHGELALADLLNRVHGLFVAGQVRAAFRWLGHPLSSLRDAALAQGRHEEVAHAIRKHPLYGLVVEDPYTRRARDKPRGYAGDAVMLDYVYAGAPPGDEELTALGRQVFSATTRGPMGLSVMFRRHLLQAHINEVVAGHDAARILSVASGHCRELAGSLVETPEFAGRFTAFDQDPDSCAEVAATHRGLAVDVVCSTVKALMAGRHADLGRFDLVYSAGLYDYLPDAVATRLTAVLAGMLAPGGRLLIANFTRHGQGRGYMEWFMDWPLLLRSEAELAAIAQAAGPGRVSSFVDPHGNVAYAVHDAA